MENNPKVQPVPQTSGQGDQAKKQAEQKQVTTPNNPVMHQEKSQPAREKQDQESDSKPRTETGEQLSPEQPVPVAATVVADPGATPAVPSANIPARN